MNIFYLDHDPKQAALWLCDKHIVKMGLEAYQMLHCAHVAMDGRHCSWMNHPCSLWARTSEDNYRWLYDHMMHIFYEYGYRYGRVHSYVSNHRVNEVKTLPPGPWRESRLTHPHLGMPEACFVRDRETHLIDPVLSYREYYKLKYKTIMARYTRRWVPEFLEEIDG